MVEQMRLQKRQLNKAQRDMTRDRAALERQEKQLVSTVSKTCLFLPLLLPNDPVSLSLKILTGILIKKELNDNDSV